MNTYQTSCGTRLKKSVIDSLIRKAKAAKLRQQFEQYGYNFCEHKKKDGSVCLRSGGVRLDCSHDISVNEAQNSGRVELAFDVDNITIRCRECHQEYDRNNIQKVSN